MRSHIAVTLTALRYGRIATWEQAIKQHLTKPLRCPPCVDDWFNGYDDRDVVALLPLDRANFDVQPAIRNKRDVQNFTDNRHGIAGYLSDPEVARTVAEML